MRTLTALIAMTILLSLCAIAAPITFSTTGTFAATGSSQLTVQKITFTGASFTIPTTAAPVDIVLGTFNQYPAATGAVNTGGVTPDFWTSLVIVGDDEYISSPLQFQWDMVGSIYDAWGLRGSYSLTAKNKDAVIPVTYSDEDGHGSFDIKLRDTRPWNNVNWGQYAGWVSLGPGGTGTIGATISNASYTLNPPPPPPVDTPEPATLAMIGAPLIGLAFLRRKQR